MATLAEAARVKARKEKLDSKRTKLSPVWPFLSIHFISAVWITWIDHLDSTFSDVLFDLHCLLW
jgi:hypothetical protein